MTGRVPRTNRKDIPIATGVLDFFPDAIIEVAKASHAGAQQHGAHNRGIPTLERHAEYTDADALLRHFIDRGEIDHDGVRHSAKMAWRALSLLQKEIDDSRLIEQLRTPDAELVGSDDEPPIPDFLREPRA